MSGLAKAVACDEDLMHVTLMDGRIISVPLAYFPRLLKATPTQRKDVRIFGGGEGLHWEEIDEDIFVPGLLANDFTQPAPERASA